MQTLTSLLATVFGFLDGLLPDSPFADAFQVTQQMSLGIGWLNWLMPIGEMLVIMSLWIAACLAITAIRVALEVTSDVGGKVIS